MRTTNISLPGRAATCLLAVLTLACGPKEEGTAGTDTSATGESASTDTGATAATDPGPTTGTATADATDGATDPGPTTSTGATTTTGDVSGSTTTGEPDMETDRPPTTVDECASTCGSSEECFIESGDSTTGGETDTCDVGFHCVVTEDCGCVNSYCETDCDPADPAACPRGQLCSPESGLCE